MDYQGDFLEQLFNRISRELGIQANLITCEEFSSQPVYGWATRLKGVNWIYINLDRLKDDFNRFKDYGGMRFESLSWIPVNSIALALFLVIVHEYTHLIDNPQSRTGLSEEDYFAMMAPLGSRDDIIRASNMVPQTEEDLAIQNDMNAQWHPEIFYSLLRMNVYWCGKILAELEEEVTRQYF